ncbi:hypothetical protein ACU7RR_002445 [Providencia stuartii]|uniref:Uncharacterized protein n=1 Tax=Providencia stuartii (strain MRSN 2154) TaxID=1157951 RepID=A0A140NSM6_PROSM|nr:MULTISPECIES: hypothetical protein [Providencia]AFH95921.1 hypothetical protein S70_20705 [Providencia stuartii MRSN 2154]MDE8744788.1 hypothetical protein [Providencia thailandensis]MDE8766007.1 hypothetical protein [Providencia thailandensis]MDE8778258.1 hypothetical protein [Providencia thailandensis]MDE8782514.1 hypothetical protein [Providencia thailandensis]
MPFCINQQPQINQTLSIPSSRAIEAIFSSPEKLTTKESELMGIKIKGIKNNTLFVVESNTGQPLSLSKAEFQWFFETKVVRRLQPEKTNFLSPTQMYKGLFE